MRPSTLKKTNSYSIPYPQTKHGDRNWDDSAIASSTYRPTQEQRNDSATATVTAVEDAAKRAAVYVFNPAIVQQLWPPQPQLAGFSGTPQQFNIHNDAMFSPASSSVSSLSRPH
jgi:hypothetical protein